MSFFKAFSQLELNQLLACKNSLIALHEMDSFIFSEQVQWYLALIYLKEGDLLACKAILNEIRKVEWHFSFKKAGKLLLELD